MGEGLTTDAIYDAIHALQRESDYRWDVGGRSNIDRYRDLKRMMNAAMAEYNALSAALPRLRALKAEADRSYDRRMTRYEDRAPECCSCHISAPCSFCVNQSDDDEPATTGGHNAD